MPTSAAGVEGPCPRCGGHIRAPKFPVMPAIAAVPLPVVPLSHSPSASASTPVAAAPIRLPVAEVERAKPLPAFVPAAQQPIIESSAMISSRRSGRVAKIFGVLLGLLVVGGVLTAGGYFLKQRLEEGVVEEDAKVLFPTSRPQQDITLAPQGKAPVKSEFATAPEGMDVFAIVRDSGQALKQFLESKTLEERLPLIETGTPAAELATSVLGQPFTVGDVRSVETRFNKQESSTDVLYSVQLRGVREIYEGHLIAVRTRGVQPPKILADPFLDGYGGRIRDFAAKPVEGAREFRCLMTCFDFCSSNRIPAAEQKCTAKLTDFVGGADLAKAYFGKAAPVREKLEKLGMKFSKSAGVTFTLRWNTTEDGMRPFLELVEVRSLDWDE